MKLMGQIGERDYTLIELLIALFNLRFGNGSHKTSLNTLRLLRLCFKYLNLAKARTILSGNSQAHK